MTCWTLWPFHQTLFREVKIGVYRANFRGIFFRRCVRDAYYCGRVIKNNITCLARKKQSIGHCSGDRSRPTGKATGVFPAAGSCSLMGMSENCMPPGFRSKQSESTSVVTGSWASATSCELVSLRNQVAWPIRSDRNAPGAKPPRVSQTLGHHIYAWRFSSRSNCRNVAIHCKGSPCQMIWHPHGAHQGPSHLDITSSVL